MSKNGTSFAGRLRQAREARGLTRGGLERRAQLAGGHVSRIEDGERSPTLKIMERLASALEVRIGWLVSGEGKGP